MTGRIATLNALSDVWAMGARPVAALAIASVPFGPEREQERVLTELLAGTLTELEQANCSLVGGHTIEGPRTTFGLSLVADQQRTATKKSDLKPDQLLVLTKPLGSGALLAAHMEAKCPAAAMKSLERTMLQSNQSAAASAIDMGASALTDVTGFGLVGHLLEMLNASNVSATIDLSRLPLIHGFESAVAQGITSTLAPTNRQNETFIQASEAAASTAAYDALFDPQTNGGILYAIDAADFSPAEGHAVIGATIATGSGSPHIRLATLPN